MALYPQYGQFIEEAIASTDSDLEPSVARRLIEEVIRQESAGNPLAKSPAGALGLMQLMPGTASDLGVADPLDPRQNIMGGTQYLLDQYKRFGSIPAALAAYNAGPGRVEKYGADVPFKETRDYQRRILGRLGDVFGGDQMANGYAMGRTPGILPEAGQDRDLDQLKALLGMDPETQKRRQRMNMIGDIFSGLAQVSASLHPTRGAELQRMYAQQAGQTRRDRELMRQSQLQQLLKHMEPSALEKEIGQWQRLSPEQRAAYGQLQEAKYAGKRMDPGFQLQQQKLQLEREKFLAGQQGKGQQLSPGQKEVDKKFAKSYEEFALGGGAENVSKNIDLLQEAIGKLQSGENITGPLIGSLSPTMRTLVKPESVNIQDLVEQVVQTDLRQTLGAQFTEKEAERLIQRSYNPRLDESKNLDRLQRLLKTVEGAYKAKGNAAKYYEEHGTLRGYKGKKMIPQGSVPELRTERRAPDPTNDYSQMSDEELLRALGQ